MKKGQTIIEVRCPHCGEYFNPDDVLARINFVDGQAHTFRCPRCSRKGTFRVGAMASPALGVPSAAVDVVERAAAKVEARRRLEAGLQANELLAGVEIVSFDLDSNDGVYVATLRVRTHRPAEHVVVAVGWRPVRCDRCNAEDEIGPGWSNEQPCSAGCGGIMRPHKGGDNAKATT